MRKAIKEHRVITEHEDNIKLVHYVKERVNIDEKFIKLYTFGLAKLYAAGNVEVKLYLFCLMWAGSDKYLIFKNDKDFRRSLNLFDFKNGGSGKISEIAINISFTALVRSNLLIRKSRGVYIINPLFSFIGPEEKRITHIEDNYAILFT